MSTDITGSKAGNEKVTVTVRPVRDPEKMCGSSNKNQIIRMLLEQSDRVEKNLYVNAPGSVTYITNPKQTYKLFTNFQRHFTIKSLYSLHY